MAIWASIVTVVMGFAAALLLFEATNVRPRGKPGQDAQSRGEDADGRRRRTLRTWGISAAIVAVIAAYVAALS